MKQTGRRYSSHAIHHRTDTKSHSIIKGVPSTIPFHNGFAAMLGDIYQQSGQLTEALHVYDTLLTSDSLNFEAWYEKRKGCCWKRPMTRPAPSGPWARPMPCNR